MAALLSRHAAASVGIAGAGEDLDFRAVVTLKIAILDALYHEARALGKFNETDLLLGLEDTIRLAAALNANTTVPPRDGSAAPSIKE